MHESFLSRTLTTLFPHLDLECGKLTDLVSKEKVAKALRTAVASMQYGNEEFLADLVAEACSKSILLD